MMLTYRSAHAKQFLGTKHEAAKIVVKLLNFEQNKGRIDNAQEMLMMIYYDSDLFKNVKLGHKSWLYGYDIESKLQLSQ